MASLREVTVYVNSALLDMIAELNKENKRLQDENKNMAVRLAQYEKPIEPIKPGPEDWNFYED